MLKWFFRWKAKDSDALNSCMLTSLYEGDRGIANLDKNDAIIRLWLPEPLRMAMNQVCKELGSMESTYLREFLVFYLYGIHDLMKMDAFKTGLYYIPPPPKLENSRGIRFSKPSMSEVIPGLGKNIVACKLKLPSKVKVDLLQLANQRNIPLGRLVREILVQHFLGHTIWPARFDYIMEEQQIADKWVEGRIKSISIPSDNVDNSTDTPIEWIMW